MKLFHIACLAGLLWLSGCATQVGTPGAASTPGSDSTTATTTAPASEATHTPQYPAGPLLPIAPARASRLEVMPLFTPSDLWDRIRRGFAMPDLQHPLVQDREQWYANRPDYMQRMTERSRKYLFYIVEELERRNMPTEIALLPFIESAFNPQAVSSAKAAGMWQFMPATGKYFELKQNAFRDDRRDVLESTRAALDYLQKLYGMFGDWELALAAYNWGEGSVSRALARNKAAGLGLSYSELNMPAETRYYVPKLQAVKNIVARPDYYRTRLPDIPNHPFFDTVDITRDIDVALAARLAEVVVEPARGDDRPALVEALGDHLHEGVGRAAEQPDHPVGAARIAGELGVEGGHHRRVGDGLLQALAQLARELLEVRGRGAGAGVDDVDDRGLRGEHGLDGHVDLRHRVEDHDEAAEAGLHILEVRAEPVLGDDLGGVAPVDPQDLLGEAGGEGVVAERAAEQGGERCHRAGY